MMGNSRTNEKDNPPPSAYQLMQTDNDCAASVASAATNVIFGEGNPAVGCFPPPPTAFPSVPSWEGLYSTNRSFAQATLEIGGNPMFDFMPNSFQNPQTNFNLHTTNTNHSEVPVLAEWNMRQVPQNINQDYNPFPVATSFSCPQPSEDLTIPRNLARNLQMKTKFGPVCTGDNGDSNNGQSGVQGTVDGSFLSLGIGGNEETGRVVANKLKEAASPELDIGQVQQTSGQSLDVGLTGFQRDASGLSSTLYYVGLRASMNEDVGVSGPGPSLFHPPQNGDGASTFVRLDDFDPYRTFGGDKSTHSSTFGGGSARFPSPNPNHSNGFAPGTVKPSWTTSCGPSEKPQKTCAKTVNSPISERFKNSASLGLGSISAGQDGTGHERNLFPQRIVASQTAGSGGPQAPTDALFPKRLGVDFIGKDGSRTAERYLFAKGISMETRGMVSQLADGGPTRVPGHLHRASATEHTQGGPFPLNSQGPFFTNDQSRDVLVRVSKDLCGATSTNAPTVDGASQRSDFCSRPQLKRLAVAPPPATHGVQRQRLTQPNVHPSTPFSAQFKPTVHPSIRTPSQIKPTVHVTSPPVYHSQIKAPVVAHITWQDPHGSPQVTGHKCLLCKRDLSFTSQGAVYQPSAPPPAAVLPCGHTFHDQCLHNITPRDQAKDPPCIPCAIGEN